MNKRIKKLWVSALRSGEYKQTGGVLKSAGKPRFCCLGVLCEVYREAEGKGRWRGSKFSSHRGNLLPPVVQRWAGISVADPKLGVTCASDLNDAGKSFNYIADRIEKYL